MTGETSKQQRQAASAAYLKMRAEHRARVADMEVIIDPGDYANVAKGLLDGPKLKNGLTARISAWPNPAPTGASDEVRLYFDGGSGNWVEVGYHKFTSPFGDVFPFPMLIDVNSLPDSATCKLKYTVTSFNDEETDSQELTVICDRRPPYNHAPPPELTLVSSELDDTNLPSTGTLAVKVRGYADWQATDDIHIYLVDAANIPEDLTGIDPVFSGKVPAPGITDTDVHIPAAKIRAFGDAQGVLLYVLVDEAKNPSALSYHKKVTLTFGPLPSTLHPPKVPQAVPGPLVNEDAVKGVSIWLEIYQNWKLGDTVRVFWGDTQVGPEIPFRNVPTFEVLVLPPVLMLEDYGASTTGIKQTNVRYEVYRQGRKFGPASANFPVNFEVPIPWIPFPPTDWPNPIHPSLLAGTVKNFDDSRTNELERADKGKDASFTIKWYAAPENGDVVNFYWNGKLVVEAKVIFDDAAHTPGADLKVTIPWAYIREGGNGAASGLNSGTNYYFDVRSSNNVGDSPATRITKQTLQVPAAPTGLYATPSVSTLDIQWFAATGAIDYVIRYGVEPGGAATTLTTRLLRETLSNLSKNTLYFVEVTARNANGESPASRITQRTLDGPPLPPRPGQLIVLDSFDTVRISWATIGQPGYEVAYGLASQHPQVIARYETEHLTWLLRHLSPDTTYFIEVRAFNATGYSPPSSATVTVGPDRTQVRNLSNPGRTYNQARLTWTRPVDPSYLINYEITCPGRPAVRTTALEYIAGELIPEREYRFTVTPLRDAGTLPALAATHSVVTHDQMPPTQVSHFKLTPSTPGNALLSWSAAQDAVAVTGYEVRRNQGNWIAVSATSYPISGLAAREVLEVRARDAAGNRSPAHRRTCIDGELVSVFTPTPAD